MNTQQIINELQLKRDDKLIFSKLARLFDENTPHVLYMDYYELAHGNKNYYPHPDDPRAFEGFHGTTPAQWESFLDIPEVFRYTRGKIAKLQEFAAVKAMKALENDPSAANLKELIKTSKNMNTGNQREKIIMTYVRPKARNTDTEAQTG